MGAWDVFRFGSCLFVGLVSMLYVCVSIEGQPVPGSSLYPFLRIHSVYLLCLCWKRFFDTSAGNKTVQNLPLKLPEQYFDHQARVVYPLELSLPRKTSVTVSTFMNTCTNAADVGPHSSAATAKIKKNYVYDVSELKKS
ncbi:unnamed protein product [Calypogeia fissa]